MDPRDSDPLHRLIAAARRKWIAVRAAEHAAGGAAAGSILAAVAVAVLWWEGRPSLTVATAIVGVSAGVGAAGSLLRRPGRVATARRLDDQHRLHDLLSTTLSLDDRADPAMAATLRALAAAAATRVAAGEPLRVARWGGRSYAAAAMAASLAIAFSAVASQDSPAGRTQVRNSPLVTNQQATGAPSASGGARDQAVAREVARSPQASAEAEAADPIEQTVGRGGERDTRGPASGAGVATSNERSAMTAAAAAAGVDRMPEAGEERSPGGSGTPAAGRSADANPVRGTADRPPLPSSSPPIAAPIAPTDRAAAERAIRGGAVPDAYRDLVKSYFSRD